MSFDVILWVMHHSEEALGRRLVLLALAENANDDGSGAWPSVETLARKSRLSTRQVKRCLAGLEESGAIRSEGLGPKGTKSWCVEMDKLSPLAEDKLSPQVDKLSPEPVLEPVQESPPTPQEGVASPVLFAEQGNGPPSGNDTIVTVFDHWRRATGHPKAQLDATRRRKIVAALKIATLGECLQAINGCAKSDYHMARGQYKGGTRYDYLPLILRDRENIERFGAMAPQTADPLNADVDTSSADGARIREAKRNVLVAYDLAGSDEARRRGDESEGFLAQQGVRVVRDSDGRPRFEGPSLPR